MQQEVATVRISGIAHFPLAGLTGAAPNVCFWSLAHSGLGRRSDRPSHAGGRKYFGMP